MNPDLTAQLERAGLSVGSAPTAEQFASFVEGIDQRENERSAENSRHSVGMWADRLENRNSVFDVFDDGLMVYDKNFKLVDANPAALRLTGSTRAELDEFDMRDLVKWPDLDERTRSAILSYFNYDNEKPGYIRVDDSALPSNPGEVSQLSLSYIPILKGGLLDFIVVVLRDFSALKHYEIELRHAQKLEAVGRLAAGIAHEINTPVQFVSDNIRFFSDVLSAFDAALLAADALYASSVAAGLDAQAATDYKRAMLEADVDYFQEDMKRALQQSSEGMDRVATIVRAMKTFAHPGPDERTLADLNSGVASTIIVARNEIESVASLRSELGKMPMVFCQLGDINQVVLNLLINASHAIADCEGGERGEVLVRTYCEEDVAVIAVSDTGTGIPDSALNHIFEPFFTTKDVGRGSGQGLALAHTIVVDNHSGSLTFETVPGEGTTFFVRLPLRGVKRT